MNKEISQLQKLSAKYPDVLLLLLFGSRARDQAGEKSDWDFGYIAKPTFDDSALYTDLVLALKTDQLDLANLSRANGLLRYRAARDGKIVFALPGQYEKFWLQAVNFWCEVGSILRAEYDSILKSL